MQTEQAPAEQWSIRGYCPGDERALVALFARVFGRTIDEAHWRWKLKQLPTPVENVWLALDGDSPIFQYAAIPTRFRLPAGEATAMVSVDTMTAPEWRRRGLLGSVGRVVYDAWRDAGIPFVLGLPNERWGSRAGALGWQPLFLLEWLVRPLRPEVLLARRLRLPGLGRLSWAGAAWNGLCRLSARRDPAVRLRKIERAGPEFDQLWRRCEAEIPVSVVRDSAWVNWRYLDAPQFDYRVLLAERAGRPSGYVAFRAQTHPGGVAGVIADLFAAEDDEASRDALLGEALGLLYAAGAASASILAIPEMPLHQALRKQGFLRGRGAFGVQLVPLAPDLPFDVLCEPRNWRLAGGDFDVV
jgi:hypothetical protein